MPNDNSSDCFEPYVEVLSWKTRQLGVSKSIAKGKIGTGYKRHGKTLFIKAVHRIIPLIDNPNLGHVALKFHLPDTPQLRAQLQELIDNKEMDIKPSYAYVRSEDFKGRPQRKRVETLEAYFSWWPGDKYFKLLHSEKDDRRLEMSEKMQCVKNHHKGADGAVELSFQNERDELLAQMDWLQNEKKRVQKRLNLIIEEISMNKGLIQEQQSSPNPIPHLIVAAKTNNKALRTKLTLYIKQGELCHQERHQLRLQIQRLDNFMESSTITTGASPSYSIQLPLSLEGDDPTALHFPRMLKRLSRFYQESSYQLLALNKPGRKGENCASTSIKIIKAGITNRLRAENTHKSIVSHSALRKFSHFIPTPTAASHHAQLVRRLTSTVRLNERTPRSEIKALDDVALNSEINDNCSFNKQTTR